MTEPVSLTPFQIDLANTFFDLPQSAGFLLAGGGALIAQGIVRRETEDLDLFASRATGDVSAAGEALAAVADERGWVVEVIRTGPEFRRLKIARGDDEVYVDLSIDSPPMAAPAISIAGPAIAPFDLAVRKTLALFGRAEPRDFTDLYALHERLDRDDLLSAAMREDDGFDRAVFVQMLRSHRRLADADFPPTTVTVQELRTYFDGWADSLGP
jgi:hypothetical protein